MGGAGRRENSTLYCLVPVFGSYVPVVEYTYFNNQIGCKVRTRAASRRPPARGSELDYEEEDDISQDRLPPCPLILPTRSGRALASRLK